MDAPRLPRLALMRLVVSPIIPRAWVARACWCLGSRRSSAGYTETGIVGKTHLDITTTVLYQVYQVIRMVVPCCAVICCDVPFCDTIRGLLAAGGCWRIERKGAPRVRSTVRAGTATRQQYAGSCATGDKSGRSVP